MPEYNVTIIRSRRKTAAIEIKPDLTVILRLPYGVPKYEADRIIASKQNWINSQLERLKSVPELPPFTREELKCLADKAKDVIPDKVKYFAQVLGVTYGRITIRSQVSRWGSCSQKGNLNFNCLLMLCPEDILDYVIVHELCHRKQLNHSPAFWAEVEKIVPDHKQKRKWLRENGSQLIRRLK